MIMVRGSPVYTPVAFCWVAVRPSVSVTKCRMGSGLEVMTVHTLRRFRLSMAVSTMVLRPMSPSTQYIPVCGP